MSEHGFTRVQANLYKRGGVFYASARVGGRLIRRSLGVRRLDLARIRLPAVLQELRAPSVVSADSAAGAGPGAGEDVGLAFWLERVAVATEAAGRKAGTVACVRYVGASLLRVWGDRDVRGISREEVGRWWGTVREDREVSGAWANHLMAGLRRALGMAAAAGLMVGNAAAGWPRARVVRRGLVLPSMEVFARVVGEVRGLCGKSGGGAAATSADWIEFLAFSGLRSGELARLRWEEVDWSRRMLWVVGGRDGAKSWEGRWVPMIPRLEALVERMREQRLAAGAVLSGRVFWVRGALDALRAGCDRAGVPRLRQHDLRHLFATACLEAGIDPPTVALWLGHRDGGALVLKTYGHVRPEHSRLAAARVMM